MQKAWTQEQPNNQIKSLEAKLKTQPENIKLRIYLAKKYFDSKEYKKCIDMLDPYSSDLKKSGLNMLALSFQKMNDLKNETRILKLIIANDPNDSPTLLRLADNSKSQAEKLEGTQAKEKLSEAVEFYRKVIKTHSNVEKAYFGLLDIFKKQKNHYESQIIVKDLIKRFGKKPSYVAELCRIYTEEAYLQEAIKSCKEAIMLDPKNPENHANLAQSYIDKDDQKTAEQILKTATRRFKSSERIYTMAGEFYLKQKNISVAHRYYSNAALIDRNSMKAQLGMAQTSFELGKFEQSLMGFENACKLNSKDTLKHFKEAVTKLRLEGNFRWERKFNSSLYRCM
ncbi:MAG: hypothetical protein KDD58_09965 [Bdellovibrionales bacterium]|nr:hypothetical protein [Bdellovibrionales bacterium]